MSGQRVGVVGDERVAEAVEAGGGVPITDGASFDTVEYVIAHTESSLVDLARMGIDIPIVAVDVEGSIPSTPFDGLDETMGRIRRDEMPTVRHPVVAVTGSFEPVRIVFDAAIMAAEPARISEFSIHRDGDLVSRFRADGVVASTPAGSAGYNRNAGGPIVAPGTAVCSVVPIAPFAKTAGHWVIPIDSVQLRVERDDTPVELLADGRRELTVEAGDPIELTQVGSIETYFLPEPE